MFTNEDTKANAQAVVDYIIQYPEQHRQQEYFGELIGDDETDELYLTSNYGEKSANSCGTTMCIAGTQMYLEHGKDAVGLFNDDATRFISKAGLNLGLSDAQDRYKLFFESNETVAFDMVNALAQGDLDKFDEIHDTRGNMIS